MRTIGKYVVISVAWIIILCPASELCAQSAELLDKDWRWIKTVLENGETIEPFAETGPDHHGSFHIYLKKDGQFFCTTSCNEWAGNFTLNKKLLSFNELSGSNNICIDSQDEQFIPYIKNVDYYEFTREGYLRLHLKKNAGWLLFYISRICKF